jgi:hypothetical protein
VMVMDANVTSEQTAEREQVLTVHFKLSSSKSTNPSKVSGRCLHRLSNMFTRLLLIIFPAIPLPSDRPFLHRIHNFPKLGIEWDIIRPSRGGKILSSGRGRG